MIMSSRVIVFDTTLRDGEQTPRVSLNLAEKLEIAQHLESMGVDVIEAGFPAASPGDLEAVRAVAKQCKRAGVAALARCVTGDIDKAWEAIKDAVHPRIHLFLATSPIHMQYKLRMSEDQVYQRAVDMVTYARKYCEDVEFSTEDGSRSEPAFLYRVLEGVINAGAGTVNIPDTVGYTTPAEFSALIAGIKQNVPNIDKAIISVHCHDDLGMAVSNTLAALGAGARQVECTVNGLGERAGNAALEEVVMALNTRKDYFNLESGIDTTQIYRASRVVSSLMGIEIPPNKSVVGTNAFQHESGIHQHGVMAHAQTYEIMTPASIGVPVSAMVLGKHSGRHAFQQRLSELGFELTGEQLDDAFARFKELADRKKDITDRDLEGVAGQKLADAPQVYELESFQLQIGNKMTATASVTVRHNDELRTEAAIGAGPVDAVLQAVNKLMPTEVTLESYKLRALTEGANALGEVSVKIRYNGQVSVGRGLSIDVIESSVRAYIGAINRAVAAGESPEK